MIAKPAAALCLTILAAGAAQSQSRELDAHQHGHGALNIAFEGAVVAMELEAPGADIVGFEHPAENAADRASIEAAIAQLARPLELFIIPAAAGCTVTAANVALVAETDHGDGHEEEHAHKDEHDHEDEHGHDDEHAEDHEGSEGEEGHTEFQAEYALTCADPAAIKTIKFAYFSLFPNAAELDIQMVSARGAKGFEVERDEPMLDLSGAI